MKVSIIPVRFFRITNFSLLFAYKNRLINSVTVVFDIVTEYCDDDDDNSNNNNNNIKADKFTVTVIST
jgi:hypothetical protein